MDGEISISPKIDLDKNKKQDRNWLKALPYPHIISSTDNIFSYGGMIERNADKWYGTYEKKEDEYYGQTGVLILEPYVDENITSLPNGYFVDERIAKIEEDGSVVPKFDEGWKKLLPRVDGSDRYLPLTRPLEGDIPTEKDGKALIWRGVDYKAMRRFVENNKMRSGEVELGLPQLDSSDELFFANEPWTAFEYAHGSGYTQPSFEQPSYVIAIKMPDTNVELRESSEVVLRTNTGIKLEDIEHLYEVRPYRIKRSREIPVREIPGKNSLAILSDDQLHYPPQGESVYREIDIKKLIFS